MAWDKTVPNITSNWQDDINQMRENNEWFERSVAFILGTLLLTGYNSNFSYDGNGKLTSISVKDASAVEKGSCTLAYSGDNVDYEQWDINTKRMKYQYTYSSGNVSKITLTITTI